VIPSNRRGNDGKVRIRTGQKRGGGNEGAIWVGDTSTVGGYWVSGEGGLEKKKKPGNGGKRKGKTEKGRTNWGVHKAEERKNVRY